VLYNSVDKREKEKKKMSGFITKIEVEANKQFIVETWGIEFFKLCMESEGKTFLQVLTEFGGI
jgi:hypothetical protein